MHLVPGDRPGENRLDRMQLEQEARDDSEVAAPAAQRPQALRIVFLAGGGQVCERGPQRYGDLGSNELHLLAPHDLLRRN